MLDTELRGLVLKRLYDIRHSTPQAKPNDFRDLPIDTPVLSNIMGQLDEKGMLDLWRPHVNMSTGRADFFIAHIGAFGVEVQEGAVAAPIEMKIINISGSQNIIGDRNVQNINFHLDAGKIVANIDSADATITEKEEAKSLLQKLMANPLVKFALEKFVKSYSSGA